jgi:phasin family protein
MFKIEDAGLYGKDAMDKALKSYSVASKGIQAITAESTDYAKKSFEASVAHMQSLMSVRSLEAAMQLQSSYAKSVMEGYVSEMTKLTEMYADMAKETFKPVEAAVSTATEVVKGKVEKAAAVAA